MESDYKSLRATISIERHLEKETRSIEHNANADSLADFDDLFGTHDIHSP